MEEPGLEAEDDLEDLNRRAAVHARLDRREREIGDQDLARVAEELARRYKPTGQKYIGDMNEIPQRLLMPSVDDANLWQIRVKVKLISSQILSEEYMSLFIYIAGQGARVSLCLNAKSYGCGVQCSTFGHFISFSA